MAPDVNQNGYALSDVAPKQNESSLSHHPTPEHKVYCSVRSICFFSDYAEAEVEREAAKQCGYVFKYVAAVQWADREVGLEAAKQNGHPIQYAAPE